MFEKYSYRILWSDEDNEFVGLCTEFPGLSWLSSSQEAAFKGIRKLVAEVIADMKKNGETLAEPISTKKYGGKLIIRMPPGVHRRLALGAIEAHISLNRYIIQN